jgi:membrane protein
MGAALAFYTVLSLAPTLLFIVATCGFVFGKDAVRGQLFWQIRNVVGDESAAAVQSILKSTTTPSSGIVAGITGILTLLYGASNAFLELRNALNLIWQAPASKHSGAWVFFRDRFFSFGMVLSCGILILVSISFSVIVNAASLYTSSFLKVPASLLEAGNFAITFLVTWFLFALIYKIIPEVRVEWRDVTAGSLLTAILFGVGRLLIGLYLGRARIASTYGAVGSLVAVLIWTCYSAQILLYGAEFTFELARLQREQRAPVSAP